MIINFDRDFFSAILNEPKTDLNLAGACGYFSFRKIVVKGIRIHENKFGGF